MSERDDGGPAFPWGEHGTHLGGMTLRDWFAGQALSGMMASPDGLKLVVDMVGGIKAAEANPGSVGQMLARCCYEYADGLLAERKK